MTSTHDTLIGMVPTIVAAGVTDRIARRATRTPRRAARKAPPKRRAKVSARSKSKRRR